MDEEEISFFIFQKYLKITRLTVQERSCSDVVEEYTQNRPVISLSRWQSFHVLKISFEWFLKKKKKKKRYHSNKVGKTTKHNKTKCVEAEVKKLNIQ